jgi:hypothetical protein
MGLIQKLLLSISDSLSEDFLQSRKIEAFIRKESSVLFRQIEEKGLENYPETDKEKIVHICYLLPQLGIELALTGLQEDGLMATSLEESNAWRAALEDGRVIHKGILQFQSARMLLSMLESAHAESAFIDANMELLLRHVEIKRENALLQYSETVSATERWEERCAYVQLFSRYANLKKDWRFLNAALKLTEWLWKEYRQPFSNLPSISLLSALVEQEFALREMIQLC